MNNHARKSAASVLLLTLVALAGCGDEGGGSSSGSDSAAVTAPPPSTTPTPTQPAPAPAPTPSPTLPPATVNAATLMWTAPTENTDGSALTDLAGYRIMHGSSPNALTQTVDIDNPSISTYIMDNLPAGTHYFAIKAYTNNGVESALSSVASKVIS